MKGNGMVKRLGERLRNRRDQLGLTLVELAQLSKTSTSYISRLERGEKDSPSVDVLARIARGLGVPMEYFTRDDILTITEIIEYYPESEDALKGYSLDYIELDKDIVAFLTEVQKRNLPKDRRRRLFDLILDFIALFDEPTVCDRK